MTPPIILLHGWTMRGAVFDGLCARLAGQAECVAPDLPGHGVSGRLPPTLDRATEMLAALVQDAENPPIVVGWSMGAAVAWRYIAMYGAGRLAGLMTVDMSPHIRPAPGWIGGLKGQTEASLSRTTARMKTDWAGSAKAIAATMFAQGNDPQGFGRGAALGQILSSDPAAMRAVWAELIAADARHVMQAVTCPWLVAFGRQSRVYGPEVAEWMAAQATDARLLGFDRSGHSPHLEEPDRFADTLLDFARSL